MRLSEKVRFAVPILNLASRLDLSVEAAQARCPFCIAPGRALKLDPAQNRFACSACESKGAQMELVRQCLKLDYDQALDWLRRTYDLADESAEEAILGSWRQETHRPSLDEVFGGDTARGLGAGARLEDHAIYEDLLRSSPLAEPATGFLERRHYPRELLADLRLGWVASAARVYSGLAERYGGDRLREAGLIDRNGSFAFNQHRLLVPFMVDGRPHFIRGRRIDGGKPEWVSLTRKQAPLFPHDRLHGLRSGTSVFLCPDVPDALALILKGLPAFALLGFESRGPEALQPFLPYDIVLCGEPDDAGHAFNRALMSRFDVLRKDVRVGELPPGFGDWNEFRLFKRA